MSDQPTTGQLYYRVIKFYELPVLNHTVIKAKIKALDAEIGAAHARHYLAALLRRDLRTEDFEYKPVLSDGLQVYSKRIKIEKYFADNKPVDGWVPPTPEAAAQAELERKQQWEK